MKYKDCEIKIEEEQYDHTSYGIYHSRNVPNCWTTTETRETFIVNGPGFRNRNFSSIENAKKAINVRQRKIDTDFKRFRKDISEAKKKIKIQENKINSLEKWMRGE